MTDRFDLEQQIMECWKVTDDIELFASQNPSEEKWQALRTYYEAKFDQLWETFETMCREGHFAKPNVK